MDTDLKNLIENSIAEFFQNVNNTPSSDFRVYNDTLCPDLWDENKHLDPETRVNLLRLAYDFYEKTEFKVPIIDVYLMGSIANFNWQPDSDVDVHILIDFSQFQLPQETVKTNVKNASSLWNIEHEVIVKGHQVELNIQNVHEEKLHVTGIYSLTKDQWVRQPSRENVNVDMGLVEQKYELMKKYLQVCLGSNDQEKMKRAKKYLDAFRQYGLDTVGEMSLENIVFKKLRSDGIIKTLKDKIIAVYDKEMSVKELALQEDGEDILTPSGKLTYHSEECVGPFYIENSKDGVGVDEVFGLHEDLSIWVNEERIHTGSVDNYLTHSDLRTFLNLTKKTSYDTTRNFQKQVYGRTWIVDGMVYISFWNFDVTKTNVSNVLAHIDNILLLQTNGIANDKNTFIELRGDRIETAIYGDFILFSDYKKGNRVPTDKEVPIQQEPIPATSIATEPSITFDPTPVDSPAVDANTAKHDLHTLDAASKKKALQAMGAVPKVPEIPDWQKKQMSGVDEDLINGVLNNLFEVTIKQVGAVHPTPCAPQLPNQQLDYSKMTMANIKALRDKTGREWEYHRKHEDKDGCERAAEKFAELHAELKRRLAYINKPMLSEMPQLSLHGKTAMANDETPLKSLPINDVSGNIAIFRVADKGGFFQEGMTLVYFMDSEEAAKDMQSGKIPYLMCPRGTIHSGGSPITDVWKKRFQKPGQEHILGLIEATTMEDEIYIDMISVRNKWQRNHIAKLMLEFLKTKFPNAKLTTSGQTEKGKKLFKSTDATEIREEGYGAGIPEQDRLHIPGERWRIKSKDAPKTPKMVNEDIDTTLDNAVDEVLNDLSKGLLIESMDVHIKGCENQFARKLDTLDGLANHLVNKALFPLIEKLPPDQKAYYEKNRTVPAYEMITPDGSYWGGEQSGTGVINFYTSGLMTKTVRQVLLELQRECRRLGVAIGKMKQEQSGVYKSQVIRIPVVKNEVKPLHRPPELNMANRNAFHIFKNVLQFEPDDETGSSFSFSTQDLIGRIQALNHDKGWVGQNQIQPTDSRYEPKEPVMPGDEWKHQDDEPEKEPEFDNPHDKIMHQFGTQMGDATGGVHMMSGGLDSDAIESRIAKILEIAMWAKENGYPEMYVA